MTYVIAEPCVDVLDQSCVAVCPVDCIHFEEGSDRKLFIDPDECIDCTLCEPECPVDAIVSEEDLPANQQHMKALNAELARLWPVITEKKPAPADADEWKGKTGKLPLLER